MSVCLSTILLDLSSLLGSGLLAIMQHQMTTSLWVSLIMTTDVFLPLLLNRCYITIFMILWRSISTAFYFARYFGLKGFYPAELNLVTSLSHDPPLHLLPSLSPPPPPLTHAHRKHQQMTDSETEVVFVFSFFSLASAYGHLFCLSICLSVITVNQRALRLYPSVLLAGTAAADVGAWDKMDFPLLRAAFLALLNGGSLKC